MWQREKKKRKGVVGSRVEYITGEQMHDLA